MTIGLGQILIIILIGLLLFGNFPNIIRDLSKGLKSLIHTFSKDSGIKDEVEQKRIQEKRDSNP